MKKLFILLTIAFISFGFVNRNQDGPQKHALIVAIGNYPAETEWTSISSLNDVKLIQDALVKQGFNNFNILRDKEADKKSIVAALNKMAKDVKPGDIVVIHFSSHGQQIQDQNNDELDGFDEAIVAYGAPSKYDALYKGENHLRDEELGDLLDRIRLKLGPKGDVLVFVDACHSGTATRGEVKQEGKKRGGVPALKAPDYVPELKAGKEGGMLENRPFSNAKPEDFAPMVVLSAAQADEVNYEYSNYGSLSLAISKSLDNLSPNFTYRALFSRILKEMSLLAPKQNPAIEGSVDRELFGGRSVVQDKYYTIYTLRKDYINLNGGMLTGVFDDCKIEVYPAGTVNIKNAEPVAKGYVTSAEGTWSSIKLDKKLEGNKNDYWVFVTEKTFGDQRVGFAFDASVSKNQKKAFMQSLSENNLLNFECENADFKIRTDNGKWNMYLTSNGSTYEKGLTVGEIEKATEAYAQGRFIKNLDLEEPGINVSFELVPALISRGQVKELLDIKDFTEGGVVSYSTRDKTIIRVTNHGDEPVFINIVDIQPDGYINAIAPSDDEPAGKYKIAPHTTRDIEGKYVEFGPPYGTEVFKLFASTEALDFSPIISSRGEKKATRSKINPIETLFANSYSLGTRGGKAGTLSVDAEVSTCTFTFKIVKP